jgi:hypothetical protein
MERRLDVSIEPRVFHLLHPAVHVKWWGETAFNSNLPDNNLLAIIVPMVGLSELRCLRSSNATSHFNFERNSFQL